MNISHGLWSIKGFVHELLPTFNRKNISCLHPFDDGDNMCLIYA